VPTLATSHSTVPSVFTLCTYACQSSSPPPSPTYRLPATYALPRLSAATPTAASWPLRLEDEAHVVGLVAGSTVMARRRFCSRSTV